MEYQERYELDNRSSMLEDWHRSTEPRLCRVAEESVHWPTRFDEWGHDNCYWDWVYAITSPGGQCCQTEPAIYLTGWGIKEESAPYLRRTAYECGPKRWDC